jgi:hypothetical protein
MDQKVRCRTTPTRLIKEKLLLESYKFLQWLSQSELHLGWNRLEENFSSWVKWIFPDTQNTILHKECSMFFFEEEPYDRVLPRNELYSCTHVSGPRDRRVSVLGLHLAHGVAASHKSLYIDDRSTGWCESVFMVHQRVPAQAVGSLQ